LLAHQVVTGPTNRVACLVCFTGKAKALQSEHRCIGKANAPIARPTAFGLLNIMQKFYTARRCFAVDKRKLVRLVNTIFYDDSLDFCCFVMGIVFSEDEERGEYRSCALRVFIFNHDFPYSD
jgi:hypothetical protein